MEHADYIHLYEGLRPIVEMAAAAAGAVSGALHAQRRGFDVVGVMIIGVVTGLGGGVIRDLLLAQGPVLVLQKPALLIVAIVASVPGALFCSYTSKLGKFKWFIDSLTLGLFAVSGVQRAQAAGLTIVPSLLLGVVTCVGGGVVRDVLCRETPDLLLPGQPYSPPALLAGITYLTAIHGFGASILASELFAVAAAFVARVLTVWLGWEMPTPPDLPEQVKLHWRIRSAPLPDKRDAFTRPER